MPQTVGVSFSMNLFIFFFLLDSERSQRIEKLAQSENILNSKDAFGRSPLTYAVIGDSEVRSNDTFVHKSIVHGALAQEND